MHPGGRAGGAECAPAQSSPWREWLIQNQGEIRLHYGEESKVFYGPNGLVEGNPLLPELN